MSDDLTEEEKETLRKLAESKPSRKKALRKIANLALGPSISAEPIGGGTVGTGVEPADMFVTSDPFDGVVPRGGSAHVDTLQFETGGGTYEITADGDSIVIKHEPEADDAE